MSDALSRFGWLHFAARSGEPGARWAAEYRRHGELLALSNEALELLRQRQEVEGRERLREYRRRLDALDVGSQSLHHVLERWFLGVEAFDLYCRGDFHGAGRAMDLAHDRVVEAVSLEPFLLVLTLNCQEFRLHHARIARNQLRWAEVHQHVQRAREMTLDTRPLCVLRDASEIFFSTIVAFLRSLGPLTEGEQEVERDLSDAGRRTRYFDRFVRRLYNVPEFAIHYP